MFRIGMLKRCLQALKIMDKASSKRIMTTRPITMSTRSATLPVLPALSTSGTWTMNYRRLSEEVREKRITAAQAEIEAGMNFGAFLSGGCHFTALISVDTAYLWALSAWDGAEDSWANSFRLNSLAVIENIDSWGVSVILANIKQFLPIISLGGIMKSLATTIKQQSNSCLVFSTRNTANSELWVPVQYFE